MNLLSAIIDQCNMQMKRTGADPILTPDGSSVNLRHFHLKKTGNTGQGCKVDRYKQKGEVENLLKHLRAPSSGSINQNMATVTNSSACARKWSCRWIFIPMLAFYKYNALVGAFLGPLTSSFEIYRKSGQIYDTDLHSLSPTLYLFPCFFSIFPAGLRWNR